MGIFPGPSELHNERFDCNIINVSSSITLILPKKPDEIINVLAMGLSATLNGS